MSSILPSFLNALQMPMFRMSGTVRVCNEAFLCLLIYCVSRRFLGRLPDPLLDASSLYIEAVKGLEGMAPLLSIPERLTWRSGWGEAGASITGCFHPLVASWTAQAYLASQHQGS